ncbi:MAG: dihydroxyacetone kinase subunit DhaL [Chloroflexota bacterium]
MMTRAQIIRWLEMSAEMFKEKKAYLTELDSAVGDADHGINMARGFTKVTEKLPSVADTDIGNILKFTGMTLISSVGGASGPLYGTFFMRAAGAVTSKEELSAEDIVNLFEKGLEGLVQRGRAEVGEKTMIDAMVPAVDAMKTAQADGAEIAAVVQAGVQAAEKGVESTIPLVARKGRASYLGERSAGHQDPGATSTFYLLSTLAEAIKSE